MIDRAIRMTEQIAFMISYDEIDNNRSEDVDRTDE